jgi:Glycosyltransferase family 87
MTDAEPALSRALGTIRAVATGNFTLWLSFVLAHLWLGMLNLWGPGLPLGDVTLVYKFWIEQATQAHFWVGIDSSWVYPIVALVPMLLAALFGPEFYASTWLSLVMFLDAAAFGILTHWGRSKENNSAAWWWVAFLFLLGPIALGRIDSISVPLAIVGVLYLSTRPRAASVVLTIATWVKVWPAALLIAAVIAVKQRRILLFSAAVTSIAIVLIALVFGSGANVFSFVTLQTSRGLQIESPVSTIWLWRAAAGAVDTTVYYDQHILTYQVTGDGTVFASALMNPLLMVAVIAVCVLGFLAVRRGAASVEVLPTLSLALVSALIAFNKVGSPQYATWLAVPVILGLILAANRGGRSFGTPATLVLTIAALTQFVYPYLYGYLISLDPVMLVVITARNLLLFVLFSWAVAGLWQISRPFYEHPVPVDADDSVATPWPLGESTT